MPFLVEALPVRHQRVMLDASDPIHKACDFLIEKSSNSSREFAGTNAFLHEVGAWNEWPAYLVAFASNGCGDYYAYDIRTEPPVVIYVDPDRTVEENLVVGDRYANFEEWYARQLAL
jgi:hypothetical protein